MGHREQNSSCPVTWDDEPSGCPTEWEATPMKPAEDAKMKNDEAERLACRLGQLGAILTVHHREYNPAPILENSTRAMTEAAAMIRTQAARIAELEGERDEYAAHVVEFSETAAELIEEMSKRPQSTWGQVKAAVRALGDIGDRRAYGKIKTRAEAAEKALAAAEARGYARGLDEANRSHLKTGGECECGLSGPCMQENCRSPILRALAQKEAGE